MDFDFNTSPTQNEGDNNEQKNTNNDGFLNMDFQSVPEQSQQKSTTLDDMLNMNFQPSTEQSNSKNDMVINLDLDMNNMNNNIENPSNPVDIEEQKRINDRKKEAEERRAKINEKMKKEEELKNEIIKKAREYMVEFEERRQENIAKKRKELEEKNSESNKNIGGGNNADSWGRINSNIDLKDSEYKGTKDVQRMREAMINRINDPNSEPLKNFFG